MKIILGINELTIDYINQYNSKYDILIYDNNRLKWDEYVNGVRVINYFEYLKYASDPNTEIIVAARNKTALLFVKDTCNPNCKIIDLKNGTLEKINLNIIKENNLNSLIDNEIRNLQKYEKDIIYYKAKGNIKVYNNALKYIKFKKENITTPTITALEFTNNCNLACSNCPNKSLKYPKGYMNDEVFSKALEYIKPGGILDVNDIGEPLMHPRFFDYLTQLIDYDPFLCLYTNGLFMDETKTFKLFDLLSQLTKSKVAVSLHTKECVKKYVEILDIYINNYCNSNVEIKGEILSHNKEEATKWLDEIGVIYNEFNKYFEIIPSHSWAGNVLKRRTYYSKEEVSNRKRNCYFLCNNYSIVKWDGIVKCCCFDAEAVTRCGSIFEFENTMINFNGYDLCNTCDPA